MPRFDAMTLQVRSIQYLDSPSHSHRFPPLQYLYVCVCACLSVRMSVCISVSPLTCAFLSTPSTYPTFPISHLPALGSNCPRKCLLSCLLNQASPRVPWETTERLPTWLRINLERQTGSPCSITPTPGIRLHHLLLITWRT
jgi:hypothetical protein